MSYNQTKAGFVSSRILSCDNISVIDNNYKYHELLMLLIIINIYLHDHLLFLLDGVHNRTNNRIELHRKFVEKDQAAGDTCLNPVKQNKSKSHACISAYHNRMARRDGRMGDLW